VDIEIKKQKEYLRQAISASLEAGQAIMEVYNSDFSVEIKSDLSPLTLADKRSHDIIIRRLRSTDWPVMSEEGRNIPYHERKRWDHFWIVDPLDGTKEFIKRNGEFTVNIALIKDGQAILGVIYLPVLKRLYFALEGLGSFRTMNIEQSHYSDDELMARSEKLPIYPLPNVYTVVGSRSHMNADTETFIKNLKREKGPHEIISRGSSLKFCMVAEGKAHIYPRLAPTNEWDTAAGQAIVECAGGKVMQTDLMNPLRYNKESSLNDGFIALGIVADI
jgi:3'(2'), 5'-bisphosphate nucleotidase